MIPVLHVFFLLIKEDVIRGRQHARKNRRFVRIFLRVVGKGLRLLYWKLFFSAVRLIKGRFLEIPTTTTPKEEMETKMTPINRREFLSVLGGAAAMSLTLPALATTSLDGTASVTSFYVKGLVMVDLGDPSVVRLGFPKAPGHKATLAVVPQNGAKQLLPIKGRGVVEAKPISSADAKLAVPELIRMKEFYGENVKSRVDQCPGVITIPRNTIRSVQATELTKSRYTFVRTDTGDEVSSFRPRQVADAIKFELSSAGALKLDGGKVIPLDNTRELRVEYTAERTTADPFADHFHHYFPYIERPAALDFDVVPRKTGAASSPTPKLRGAHHFMMLDDVVICSLVAVP
jgi:hypothetical protein